MSGAPINSSEYIYLTLKQEILNLILKPGQSISETQLCERFAVSRTPIRSVLQRLSNAGLVNIIPYKGTFVSMLNFNDIQQMIYMRIAVESAVIREFMQVYTPFMEEKLRYLIRKQIVLIADENFKTNQFYKLDSQFHKVWFKETHKERLWQLIEQAEVNYTRFRMLDIVAVQNFQEIIHEHEEIFTIIHEKRTNDIEPAIEKHLRGGISRLGDKINTEFQDYFQKESESIIY